MNPSPDNDELPDVAQHGTDVEARACHRCGHSLEPTAQFCGHCGTSVLEDDPGASAQDDPYIGRVIDSAFRIEERIGVGSMGVVYRATQLSLNKTIALKILRESFVRDRVVLQRFRREALAASQLKHPNTINVIHFGECFDGAPYIAMEFLAGRDLGSLVTEEFPLSTQRVVSLLMQCCQALEEAHGAGIIHRDIKPANIVVSDRRGEEFVKVLDFGIAKLVDASGEGLTSRGPERATRADAICGTPAFMSPEQVQGKDLDARSDLFSLGIVMYYLLSGRLPFAGESSVDMAAAILYDEPRPPSKARLGTMVAPEVEAVCMRMLSKDPAARCQSAGEMRAALQAAYQAHLDAGGDERFSATTGAIVVGGAAAAALAKDVNQATVVQMEAFVPPSGPRSGVSGAAAGSPHARTLLIAALAVLLIGAIATAVVLLTAGGGDDAVDAGAASEPQQTDSETAPPARDETDPVELAGQVPAHVEVTEPAELTDPVDTAAVLDPDDEALDDEAIDDEAIDDDDDESGGDNDPHDGLDADGNLDEAELATLPPRERRRIERKAKRRQSVRLYKKAKRVWRSNTPRAIDLLEEAVDLYSGSYRTWELLGDAYTRVANRSKAAHAYSKVLKLEPNHERAVVLRKLVEAAP